MPDINVTAGDVSSGRFSLVAGQVSTVSFADDVRDWTNVVLACLDCNLSKNAKPVDQWLAVS